MAEYPLNKEGAISHGSAPRPTISNLATTFVTGWVRGKGIYKQP
jgi:hypothetical protein